MQVEAFLGEAAEKVAAIEHRCCHYGTAMVLIADLYQKGCAAQAPLEVQLLPATAAVADRVRPTETISAKDLDPVITLARKVLKEELHERFFIERPSNAAMVLMYMTKQGPQASDYLTPAQTELAKTLYLSWLRSAHDKIVAKSPSHAQLSSPRNPAKKTDSFLLSVRTTTRKPRQKRTWLMRSQVRLRAGPPSCQMDMRSVASATKTGSSTSTRCSGLGVSASHCTSSSLSRLLPIFRMKRM